MTDMHSRIPRSFASALHSIGAELLLADHSFNEGECKISYGRKWSQEEINAEIGLDNVKSISQQALLDSPPDVFFIMCAEQMHDQMRIWSQRPQMKLAWYSGNDNTGIYYAQSFGPLVQNILATDIASINFAKQQGLNILCYYPWIDYETFSYAGPNDDKVFGTFINNYQKLFPHGHEVGHQVMQLVPDIQWRITDGANVGDVPGLMKNCMAVLHCKNLEGYGYSIIESLARGRPVILFEPFSFTRSYRNWCVDYQTAIYFNDGSDFLTKVRPFIDDVDYRHEFQLRCAKVIREKINNDEQTANLRRFLNELR